MRTIYEDTLITTLLTETIAEPFRIETADGVFNSTSIGTFSVLTNASDQRIQLFIQTEADCPAWATATSASEAIAAGEKLAGLLHKIHGDFFACPSIDEVGSFDGEVLHRNWINVGSIVTVGTQIRKSADGITRLSLRVDGRIGDMIVLARDASDTRNLSDILDDIQDKTNTQLLRVPPAGDYTQMFLVYDNFVGISIPAPDRPELSQLINNHDLVKLLDEMNRIEQTTATTVRVHHRHGHLDFKFDDRHDAVRYVTDFINSIPTSLITKDFVTHGNPLPILLRRDHILGISGGSDSYVRITLNSRAEMTLHAFAGHKKIATTAVAKSLTRQLIAGPF